MIVNEIIAYCQTERGTSHATLLRLGLDYARVKNYDGSWMAWPTTMPRKALLAGVSLTHSSLNVGLVSLNGTKTFNQAGGAMSVLTRLKNRFLSRMIAWFPKLGQRFAAAYQPRETSGEIPWTRPAKPLRQAKLALVTTSGIHHHDQPPFDMHDQEGDPSYRVLSDDRLFDDFQITHDYYDHAHARKDPNIILPLDRLRELVADGVLGSLATTHYAFMGHIDGRHITTLVEKTAREVADRLKADQVDLVFLTPA